MSKGGARNNVQLCSCCFPSGILPEEGNSPRMKNNMNIIVTLDPAGDSPKVAHRDSGRKKVN